jgi:Putative undecaprenyl diphosphate synthase
MLKRISMLSSSHLVDTVTISSALSAINLQHAHHDNIGDDDGYDYEAYGNLSDLSSPICNGCFCTAPCPDDPILHRIIRWVKIIARSKHGMTVVCGVLPLLFGLLIGFYLGRRWERSQQKHSHKQVEDQRVASGWLVRASSCFQVWIASVFMLLFTASVKAKQPEDATTLTRAFQSAGEASVVVSDEEREEQSKQRMLKDPSLYRQSGVDLKLIPKHIAFIMDGNRRYGKSKYKSVSLGHKDGGYRLRDMVHWCLEECVQEITVYAFSTENWNRSPSEIDALMSIFCQQCDDLRREATRLKIVVRVLSTDTDPASGRVDDTINCRACNNRSHSLA